MSQTITVVVTNSVSTSPGTGYFIIPGNFTSLFYPGFQFMLFNQSVVPYPQEIPYTVVSSAFVDGNTQVTVNGVLAGSIVAISTVTPGTGPFVSGTYNNVQLTGGNGTGAQATVVNVGPGPIASLGSITGGSGYNNNVYTNVPLTGGTGTGAVGTVVVTGGQIVNVQITTAGTGYVVDDSLSASNTNLGGYGSGFAVSVAAVNGTIQSVTLTSAGTGYETGDVLTFGGAFGIGTGSTVTVNTVTQDEIGTITLENNQPMFVVGQQVYAITVGNASCQIPWWAMSPQNPAVPAVQSAMVLGVTVAYTNSATSPAITYSLRLGNNPGVTLLDQSVVFVDKATAIAAYEAMNL